MARRLTGSAGCSSVDSALLRDMLLRHQGASTALRSEMVEWVLWLGNTSPPWAAYRAMRQGRLVALDKQPGVRPLGIGESWLRCVSKCVLRECGKEGKAACGSTQLCAGLEAGIEGAIHAVRKKAAAERSWNFEGWEIDDDLWRSAAADGEVPPWEQDDATAETEPLTDMDGEDELDPLMKSLADADNGFNALGRMNMLWVVRHKWARGARYAFNLYRHDARLMVRGPVGTAPKFILSREGVTQGCPLGMILYGVALLPLAEDLRVAFPGALQPWYADDFAMVARASVCAGIYGRLCRIGPSVGYFASPPKSWGICPRRHQEAAQRIFQEAGLQLKWSRGQRYVGGFVGSIAMRDRWLSPMVKEWVAGVERLAAVATKFPQSAYFGLTQCLQAEWQYLCRVEPDVGPFLQPVEDALRLKFIPALFGGLDGPINDEFRQLLGNRVKQGGIAVANPCDGAQRLYQASVASVELLVDSLLSNGDLNNEAHVKCVLKGSAGARVERFRQETEFVEAVAARGGVKVRKRLERMKSTGSWLVCCPDRFSGTILTLTEWEDNLRLKYGLQPKNLPKTCDGCGCRFSVEHGLSCKFGGLVDVRHNDARDEWAHLCSMATTASKVSTEPLIFPNGTASDNVNATAANGSTNNSGGNGGASRPTFVGNRRSERAGDEARGDVRCRDFWNKAKDTIFDIRICDTDAKSYGNVSSEKVLERFARQKKEKYEEACRENRRDFTPMVYSVDGLACEAARAAEKRLGGLLAKKWDRRYSEMVAFIRQRMSLAIVRSNTMLLRGERANTWRRRACEDGVAAGAGFTARSL